MLVLTEVQLSLLQYAAQDRKGGKPIDDNSSPSHTNSHSPPPSHLPGNTVRSNSCALRINMHKKIQSDICVLCIAFSPLRLCQCLEVIRSLLRSSLRASGGLLPSKHKPGTADLPQSSQCPAGMRSWVPF